MEYIKIIDQLIETEMADAAGADIADFLREEKEYALNEPYQDEMDEETVDDFDEMIKFAEDRSEEMLVLELNDMAPCGYSVFEMGDF